MTTARPLPAGATQPVSSNPFAAFINGLINAILTAGEDAAKTYISVQAPWLMWPIINIFTNSILDGLVSSIETQTAQLVYMAVDVAESSIENSALKSAASQLQAAQASGDQNAIATATQNMVNAYRNLGAFNGA